MFVGSETAENFKCGAALRIRLFDCTGGVNPMDIMKPTLGKVYSISVCDLPSCDELPVTTYLLLMWAA